MFLKRKIRNFAVTVIAILSAILVMTLGGTGASAATTAHSAATAVEASTVPDTVYSCTYGLSSGNIRTCFGIDGTGQLTYDMWMTAEVNSVGRYLHFEIVGPSFPKGINSPGGNFYVGPGQGVDYQWDFPPYIGSGERLDIGNYSGILWRWLGGTSYTMVAKITWQIL
jgi:hypothetical protein